MGIKNLVDEFTSYFNRLLIEINPYSIKKKKRPPPWVPPKYTRDILKGRRFDIGEYTYGTPEVLGTFICLQNKLKIGRFCSIAMGVKIFLAGNHRMDLVTTYPFGAYSDKWPGIKRVKPENIGALPSGDVIIGNDVWIGIEAIILPGVRIGDGAIIGARAVVTKDVEPYSIVAGNPARPVRKRFDDATISKLLEIKWWDWPPEKINENLDIIRGDDISRIFQVR